MMRPVVIVMVKAPVAGFAKTRLTPALSPSDAASLALCFVQDVINSALAIISNVVVAFAPDDGDALLKPSLPKQLLWVKQHGEDLGERLNSAIAYATGLGFSPIIVLGADSPTLPPSYIKTACDALTGDKTDVVLGPSTDGGYYLLGVRETVPNLFHNIAWSTARTLDQTAHNINQLGLRLLELPQWYDVDTFADLGRLCNELNRDQKARSLAQGTHRWLLTHGLLPRSDD
jgi:rSAM/selenodomain-associated transferase 1